MDDVRPLTYDAAPPGLQIGPVTFPLADRVERHLEAVANLHPWHHGPSPFGGPIAPPTVLGNLAFRLLETGFRLAPGTLHAKQQFRFLHAVPRTAVLAATGTVADRYVRRERRWIVFEARFRAEPVGEVGVSELTLCLPAERGAAPADSGRPGAHASELVALTKPVTQAHMTLYSGEARSAREGTSIHIYPDVARAQGLPGTLAQGLMTADYVSEMLTAALGEAWVEGGELSLAFIGPVYAGDTLTTGGRLADREGSRPLYEVWCANQRRAVVTIGMASARPDAPALAA
jgi:acyl dehydratase